MTLQYPEGAPLSDSEIIKLVDASVAYEQEHAEARWELSDAIDSLLRGADYVAGLQSLGPSAEVSLAHDVIDIIEEAKEMKLWLEKRPWARREDIRDKLDSEYFEYYMCGSVLTDWWCSCNCRLSQASR